MRQIRRHSQPRPGIHGLAALVFAAALLAAPAASGETAIFKRGDANADSVLDVSDATFTLHMLFTGGASGPCDDAADSNDDGALDIADPVYTLFHLFLGAPEPPAPGRACGLDPSPDSLGCSQFLPCGHTGGTSDLAKLKNVEGCDELLDELRGKLIETMESTLDENLQIALQIVRGEGCPIFLWEALADFDGRVLAPAPLPEDGGEAAEDYSETNNQVAGVDEADFIKNDGGYIYILADGKFQIIDAWPAPEARKIASVELEGTPKKLFVHADRAVVYSSLESLEQPIVDDPSPGWWGPMPRPNFGGDCTYGYDCEFTGDGRRLQVSVFDISDRSQPQLLREMEFSGSYLNARRLGDVVHTVVVFPEIIVPAISYWPEALGSVWDLCWKLDGGELPFTEEELRAMFEALRQANVTVIEEASIADFLPAFRDTRYEGGEPVVSEGLLQNCEDFYLSGSRDGQSLLSLVSFDMTVEEDAEATTIFGRPGAVYASSDSLYVATRHYRNELDNWFYPSGEEISEATTVHKFEFSGDGVGASYAGSGVTKGHVLNQFSMDEYEGYLRIATTTGRVPDPNVHSTVSVLAGVDDGLIVVGEVDSIAPGEDIRSVRFNEDVAYVVTFKKTDPLFVIELADPLQPRVRGELKIPGFSTYMHLLPDDHVLSIGYDADDQGNFAWFRGILLQIFDARNLDDPLLLHRELIGTRGSTSDATTDHLAFNFFRSRGLLALPMVICEGGEGGGRYGDEMTFSGLLVYRVGLDTGFELLGGVPHDDPATGDEANSACRNWWTNSNSQVKRSVFMEDWVYSVALDEIQVSSLADLEHPVASVPLTE